MNCATGAVLERDLLIIGAGPVGLYAGYYAGFRGLSMAIVDSLPELGGQISAMYPEKPIYDVAGFPEVLGRELVENLVLQVAPFQPTYLLGQRAVSLIRGSDGTIDIETEAVEPGESGVTLRVRAVVISAGIGGFTPRPLPAGADWHGRGVSFFVPSLSAHTSQDVIVVGGGDSACDWALSLEPLARSVTIVHRRAEFRAHAHTVKRLFASTVEVVTDAEVTKLIGGGSLELVEITRKDGTTMSRPAQAVVAALGFTANLGPLRQWGMHIAGNRYISVASTMATNLAGGLRRRRRRRLSGQGSPHLRRIRRSRDGGQQCGSAHTTERAAVSRPLLGRCDAHQLRGSPALRHRRRMHRRHRQVMHRGVPRRLYL